MNPDDTTLKRATPTRLKNQEERLDEIQNELNRAKILRRKLRTLKYTSLLKLKELKNEDLGAVELPFDSPSPNKPLNRSSYCESGSATETESESETESETEAEIENESHALYRTPNNHVSIVANSSEFRSRRLGSILTQTPLITPEMMLQHSQKTSEQIYKGIDIHIHAQPLHRNTRAIQGLTFPTEDNVVTLETNPLYDLRILSDNPAAFVKGSEHVLKNVVISEESRELLKTFRQNRVDLEQSEKWMGEGDTSHRREQEAEMRELEKFVSLANGQAKHKNLFDYENEIEMGIGKDWDEEIDKGEVKRAGLDVTPAAAAEVEPLNRYLKREPPEKPEHQKKKEVEKAKEKKTVRYNIDAVVEKNTKLEIVSSPPSPMRPTPITNINSENYAELEREVAEAHQKLVELGLVQDEGRLYS